MLPTTQNPVHIFKAYETAEATKAPLFFRGIARMDPSGGGFLPIFAAVPRRSSGLTPLTRAPGTALGAAHAATTTTRLNSPRAASLPSAEVGTMHAVSIHSSTVRP